MILEAASCTSGYRSLITIFHFYSFACVCIPLHWIICISQDWDKDDTSGTDSGDDEPNNDHTNRITSVLEDEDLSD